MQPMHMGKLLLRPLLLVSLLCLSLLSEVTAQEGGNPFELSPRLAQPVLEDSTAFTDTGNPFDLIAPSSKEEVVAIAKPEKATPSKEPARKVPPSGNALSEFNSFYLITNIGSLLLLTILVTLFRSQLGRAYRAFLNDNLLTQLQRDREVGGGFPYYIFYGFFMLNAGLFLFLLSRHYGFEVHPNRWVSLLFCTLCVFTLFLAKHIVLGLLASIFPVAKEARLYSFTIIIFHIMLGLLLVVANLLLSYSNESLVQIILYGTFGLMGLLYLFLAIRGLFIANRFILFHKFHILLYICTVEIAPVIVLAKLIIS